MKRHQNFHINLLKHKLPNYAFSVALMLSLVMPLSAEAVAVNRPIDLAMVPLAETTTTPIQTNLLFIFDDSGSMADDNMPDSSNSNLAPLFRNAAYNTIYYSPAITYLPPVNFTSGGIDTATYPSQTGMATASGASAAAKPNWENVERDAYGILSTARDNLTNNASFFTTIPGEFCTSGDLKTCNTQSAPTAAFPFPAPVRWCNTNANALLANPAANTCQATNVTGFTSLRMPSGVVSTITFSNTGARTITNITVGGQRIMSAATTSTGGNNNAAQSAANINACSANIVGQCQVAGYIATVSGNVLRIYSPTITALTPVVAASDLINPPTILAFARDVNPLFNGVNNAPGITLPTVITSTTTSYSYPGTSSAAISRTDCAGATCSYAEEMTNYANWYTYYRTRTQMMKTATSLAFKDIGDDFKVGFMTTSGFSNRARNFARFTTANKALWYNRLFTTVATETTPLRGALSTAGRIYATRTTLGGVFTDPIEYECQKNFTLLTTDGFWNTGLETATYGPLNLTGSNVGNLDAAPVPRGMREGTPAVSNTLADVAKYYKDTDLRTTALGNCAGALGAGTNVCQTTSADTPPPNEKQTMTTLTMGLGADGTLTYIPGYTKKPGDYLDIVNNVKNWPDPIAGTTVQRIDDLWHAAVNGGGTYFSAKNPSDVVTQLKEALASIKVSVGTGSAAAASTLNPVSGDNFAYVGSYTSGFWAGNLESRAIDPSTGEVQVAALNAVEDVLPTDSCAAPGSIQLNALGGYDCVKPGVTDPDTCKAPSTLDGTDCYTPIGATKQGKLKNQVALGTRKILFNQGGTLGNFRYSNLTTAQRKYFDPAWLAINLTQWPSLSIDQQTKATGTNLVDYLRGETTYDFRAADPENRVFRKRETTLGDLVHSKPDYYDGPELDYVDPGYQDYKAAAVSSPRAKTVFVGANDGMLHAFNADTMEERWAFVPSMVIPNMWRLADTNYAAKHAFYVDGDIVTADVCTANCTTATATWRTILVAGLRGGGRGYFALDITDANNPTLLWEFDASSSGSKADPNLGYSYGNPIVTKRNSDNKWVVLFTSGYNNIPDNNTFYTATTPLNTKFKPLNNAPTYPAIYTGGDGKGYLFVVDAVTGNKLNTISTGVGTVAVPSGLSKISNIVEDSELNNATTYVYGGDLLGNLWRFNVDNNTVNKVAELQSTGGIAQPITTAPELGLVQSNTVVFVGTGKYLEESDLLDTDQQTLYAIKNNESDVTTIINPQSLLTQQTIGAVSGDSNKRQSTSSTSFSFSTGLGWFVNFIDSGERVNIEPQLELGTLLVPTLVTAKSACQPAGYGWFNYFDYQTGRSVPTSPSSTIVSQRLTSPSAGFNIFSIDGKPVVSNSGVTNPNPDKIDGIPFNANPTGFGVKRSIWREITE